MATKPKPKKKEPPKYGHTDEELKKLAQAMIANQVFCTDQLRRPRDIGYCFMVLNFLKKKDLDEMKKAGVVHFYEYNRKAMPSGINGHPCFISCRMLTKPDYMKLREYETKLRSAMENAL